MLAACQRPAAARSGVELADIFRAYGEAYRRNHPLHRYHSMPFMPKRNTGLFCQPAYPCTMGFFVMINQRTENGVLVLLCARAHASVRPVLLPLVLLWRFATRLQPIVAPKTARYFHDQPCCYVCFLAHTISIDTRHCFTQRFSPTGFILNASDSNCCHPSVSPRIQVKTYPFDLILHQIASAAQLRLTAPSSLRDCD
jgi:hypothetical protein